MQKKQRVEEESFSKREGDVSLGNPNLISETSHFNGGEPTGCAVRMTTCCYIVYALADNLVNRTEWRSRGIGPSMTLSNIQ